MADWMNEKSWERTDKGGSSTESFDLRGRVSLLFCVLFFVVVLLHIFSLLHRRRSQRRLYMEERAFFGKEFQAFHFWKRSFSTVGSLYRLKSRVLSFFFGIDFGWKTCFWIAETCDDTTSLEHPFAMLSLSWHSALMRSIEETLIGEVRWFLIEIYHWKYHMFKSICVF